MPPPKKPAPPPPALEPAAPHDELPEVRSIGIVHVKGGYAVVKITSQGLTILETELLSPPLPRMAAMEASKLHFAREVLIPQTGTPKV